MTGFRLFDMVKCTPSTRTDRNRLCSYTCICLVGQWLGKCWMHWRQRSTTQPMHSNAIKWSPATINSGNNPFTHNICIHKNASRRFFLWIRCQAAFYHFHRNNELNDNFVGFRFLFRFSFPSSVLFGVWQVKRKMVKGTVTLNRRATVAYYILTEMYLLL